MSLFKPSLALVLLVTLSAGVSRGSEVTAGTSALPALNAQATLLVVAPHPDDETLCCAGVIQAVLGAGGRAHIVWLTSGDGAQLGELFVEHSLFSNPQRMRAYGERRMREARAATAVLGVAPAGQLFLGYPDGGLEQLLGEYRSRPYRSRFTAAAAVPYGAALVPGHPYTGDSLAQDFAAVLARVRPTLILAPSPLDSHSDHHAAALLTIAATRDNPAYAVRYWIVHGGEGWPSPRGLLPGVPLTPAPLGATLAPEPFALSLAAEDRKLQALRAYETQMLVMEPFLLAFVRTTELFSLRPGAPAVPH